MPLMQVTSRHKRIMKTFGNRLREARERAGYVSAASLAAMLGLEPHTYRKYERGQSEPNFETLDRIYRLLKVTPNYLFPDGAAQGGTEPPQQPTAP